MNVKNITKLDGYSNFVFKVVLNDDRILIFKQLLQKEFDPFKSLQEHAEQKLNKKYLYNQNYLQVEKYIVNVRLDIDTVFENKNLKKLIRNIANINRANKIKKKIPNLIYIIENNKQYIYDKIEKRIQDQKEPILSLRQNLFKYAKNLYNEMLQYFKEEQDMVLCHNDLFYYNFLYKPHKDDFEIIDFEYAGYNPLGHDLMNLLNERILNYENLQVEYNRLPTKQEIESHVRFYLYCYQYPEESKKITQNKNFLNLLQKDEKFSSIENSQIQKIIQNFPLFGVLLNLFWIFFYLQFPEADIDLDLDRFLMVKKELAEKFYNKLKNNESIFD